MADSVTIAKGIIEIGATGVADAQAEIQALELKLQMLDRSYKQGNVTVSAYAAKTQILKDNIAALKGGIDTATVALQKHGTAQAALTSLQTRGATASTAASRGAAQAMMELGRGVEDFATGGFLGGLNNIPRMIEGIGQTAGVVGAKLAAITSGISLAATAAYMIYKSGVVQKFIEESGLFGEAAERITGDIDRLKAHIAKLEEKPIKLEVDLNDIEQATRELKRLEEAKRAFDSAGKGRDPYEKKAGEAAQEVFDLPEGQAEAIKQKLFGQVLSEMTTKDISGKQADVKEAEARVATATDAASKRMAGEQLRIAQDKLKDAREEAGLARAANKEKAKTKVGELYQGINEGNDPKARAEMARRLRKAGEENLARSVELANPEELLKQDQIDDEFDESMGRHGRGEAKRDAKEAKAEASAKAATDFEQKHDMEMAEFFKQKQDKENDRLAGAMTGSVGQSLLAAPGMDEASFQNEIKTAMDKAGVGADEIAEAVQGVAKKLREKMDKAVEARALERGVSWHDARKQLLEEAQAKDDKRANLPKSEVMSTDSYLSKVLIAGASKKDDNVPKDQLAEAKKTNDKLDGVIRELGKPQKSIPATVGPGR